VEEKNKRYSAIKEILQNYRVEDQDFLLKKLSEYGFTVTQATLSRDLKNLKIGKKPDSKGGYFYHLTESDEEEQVLEQFRILKGGLLSIAFSHNICVLKTKPGYANSIAALLDGIQIKGILGTVAGDDTIFALLEEGKTREDIKGEINQKFPFLKEKFI
jgi:transcriptional regulator of arginine metabolism